MLSPPGPAAAAEGALDQGWTALHLADGQSLERARCLRSLRTRGFALPLGYQTNLAWQADAAEESLLVGLEHGSGRYEGAYLLRSRPLSFPRGYRLLRAERFGATLCEQTLPPAVDALHRLLEHDRRILRLDVEVFSRAPDFRAAIGRELERAGFRAATVPSCYRHTLVVDLRPSEADILASFHATARRAIRRIGSRDGFRVAVLTDPAYAPRMEELRRETLAATGGTYLPLDWKQRIRFSASHPGLSRLCGLVRGGGERSGELVAFTWGCNHGDHVQYRDGASSRHVESGVPLMHGLIWDLAMWGRSVGASWFDLGGVPPGEGTPGEQGLQGIANFKRLFSRHPVTVGDEWTLVPPTFPARLADRVRHWLDLLPHH